MIHIIQECGKLYNGFNFYPLSNTSSFGFKFRYGRKIPATELGSKLFVVRYSKANKKWYIRSEDMTSVCSSIFNGNEIKIPDNYIREK